MPVEADKRRAPVETWVGPVRMLTPGAPWPHGRPELVRSAAVAAWAGDCAAVARARSMTVLDLDQLALIRSAYVALWAGDVATAARAVRVVEGQVWPIGVYPHARWPADGPALGVADAGAPAAKGKGKRGKGRAKVKAPPPDPADQPWIIDYDLAEGETLVENLWLGADRYMLSKDQRLRLRHGMMLLAKAGDGSGTKTETAQLRAEASEIARTVARELGEGLSESVRLDRLRDPEGTARKEGSGRLRVSHRDGLLVLYDSGALTGMTKAEREDDPVRATGAWALAGQRRKWGESFRSGHERLSAGLRSQLAERIARGGTIGAPEVGFIGAKEAQMYELVLAFVMVADRSGRALRVLRAVAGDGDSLRSLGAASDERARNLAALLVALDQIGKLAGVPRLARLTGLGN